MKPNKKKDQKQNKPQPKEPNMNAGDIKTIIANAKGPISLQPGGNYSGFYISGVKKDIELHGNGAIVNGTVKFENCGVVKISGLHIKNGNPYGIQIVNCAGCEINNCLIEDAEVQGIETANTPNCNIHDNTITGVKQQHGIYCSQSGDNIKINSNNITNVYRSGIQVNAVEDSANPKLPKNHDSISENVEITGNHIGNCQKAGAGAIQLSGVHGCKITGNNITNNNGRNMCTLWDDGSNNPQLACKDIEIDGNYGAFSLVKPDNVAVNIGKNCTYHLGINKWVGAAKDMVQQ